MFFELGSVHFWVVQVNHVSSQCILGTKYSFVVGISCPISDIIVFYELRSSLSL